MKNYTLDIYDRSRVNLEILTEIINLFVIKDKRNRFLEFIKSPKRYEDFLDEFLNDPRNLESKFIINPEDNQQNPEYIIQNFGKTYANRKAYWVSTNDENDGKIDDLGKILSSVVGFGDDNFVYCIGTNFAYYEGHENWRYIFNADKK